MTESGPPRVESPSAKSAWSFGRFVIVWSTGYPILWFVGLGGLFWIVLGLVASVWMLRQKVSMAAALPLLVVAMLVLSSPIGIATFGFQVTRIVSLAGNAMVWLSLAAILVASYQHLIDLRALARAILAVAAAQGAVSVLAMVLHPFRLPIPLLDPISSSLPTGFAAFANNKLYFSSWLDGIAFRSAGMSGQPTWAGALGACAILIGVHVLLSERGHYRFIAVAGIAGGFASLALSLSRSGWIALVIAAIAGLLVAARRLGPLIQWLLVTWAALGAAIVAITSLDRIGLYLEDLNAQREGSAEARGEIYARTWEYIQTLPVPLVGFGIKPQESDLVASVATHSTYLGLIFRGGFPALLAFAILLLAGLVLTARYGLASAFSVLVFIAVWSFLEDFDPGHLVPLAAAWAIGSALVEKRKRDDLSNTPRRTNYRRGARIPAM